LIEGGPKLKIVTLFW